MFLGFDILTLSDPPDPRFQKCLVEALDPEPEPLPLGTANLLLLQSQQRPSQHRRCHNHLCRTMSGSPQQAMLDAAVTRSTELNEA